MCKKEKEKKERKITMAPSQIMRPMRLEDYCKDNCVSFCEIVGDLITCSGVCAICSAANLNCKDAARTLIATIANPQFVDLPIDISRRILGSLRVSAIDKKDEEDDS